MWSTAASRTMGMLPVTSVGEAWSGTNVFVTFIAYDRFVVLRPAQLG